MCPQGGLAGILLWKLSQGLRSGSPVISGLGGVRRRDGYLVRRCVAVPSCPNAAIHRPEVCNRTAVSGESAANRGEVNAFHMLKFRLRPGCDRGIT
jgi:hypothetical protein